MSRKSKVAALRVQRVSEALFVLSRSDRYQSRSLGEASEVLRQAELHRCLHVVHGAQSIPFAVVFVAALSVDDINRHHAGKLEIFEMKKWISGTTPVVLDVVSLDSTKDALLEDHARVAIERISIKRPVAEQSDDAKK